MTIRRTRIKFCGMRRAEDIDLAVALGVDAIGLILVPGTPRALSLAEAQALRARIPPLVSAVALVMDATLTQVAEILQRIKPDLIQFHGSEEAADCERFGRYLKAIPMADPAKGLAMLDAHPRATGYVLDAHAPGAAGGSGRVFDWARIPATVQDRLVLAGGLVPDNVEAAVRGVRPFAVDVSSGIEDAPGVKSPDRMMAFVRAVRRADDESAS